MATIPSQKSQIPAITTAVPQYGAGNNSRPFDRKFNAVVYGIPEYVEIYQNTWSLTATLNILLPNGEYIAIDSALYKWGHNSYVLGIK